MSKFVVTEPYIYQTIQNVVTEFPRSTKIVVFHAPLTVRKSGFEENLNAIAKEFDPLDIESHLEIEVDTTPWVELPEEKNVSEDDKMRSMRRTKKVIQEIVLMNEFEMFTTFTFADDKLPYPDYAFHDDFCDMRMHRWLNKQSTRYGRFDYLIVKEYGSVNCRIHYHGLFNNYKGKIKDSGIVKQGSQLYNLPGWRSGFSTMSFVKNQETVSSYVRKYITKTMIEKTGKKRYWCSHGLKRPKPLHNVDLEQYDLTAAEIYQNHLVTVYTIKK